MAIVNAENARKDIPLVSIIAVCYNHSKFVKQTLDSILNQSYENIELVIIDSNSPDNSVEVIQSWITKNNVDCAFIQQKKPQTICENLNAGLDKISGAYFQGLSCDDILLKDKIKNQVQLFDELDNSKTFLFGNAEFIDSSGELTKGRKDFLEFHSTPIKPDFNNMYESMLKSNFIAAMSVLIKTKAVKDLGGYDTNLSYEDYDMWLQLLKDGENGYFENKINCQYRIHSSNLHEELANKWHLLNYWIYKKHVQHNIALEKVRAIAMRVMRSNDFKNPILTDYFKNYNKSSLLSICYKLHIPNSIVSRLLSVKSKFTSSK